MKTMTDAQVMFTIAFHDARRNLKEIEIARNAKKSGEFYRGQLSSAVKDMCEAIKLK